MCLHEENRKWGEKSIIFLKQERHQRLGRKGQEGYPQVLWVPLVSLLGWELRITTATEQPTLLPTHTHHVPSKEQVSA